MANVVLKSLSEHVLHEIGPKGDIDVSVNNEYVVRETVTDHLF